MTNPYTFNFDPETGLKVTVVKQDIISSDDQIEVEELHRMMEKDRREEANREDLEFMDECREDKMAWDVDESQA